MRDRPRGVAESRAPTGYCTGSCSYVTLTGQVRRHFQRMAAEHAVGRVDGVLGIDDKVTLTSDPIPSDVADRIQKALRRDVVIDDSLIEVTNSGHTIYLDGKTSSIAARNEAETTAWYAPGVTDVVDRLEIGAGAYDGDLV